MWDVDDSALDLAFVLDMAARGGAHSCVRCAWVDARHHWSPIASCARLWSMSEGERRERAKARQARGITVERIDGFASPKAFHADDSVEDRLRAMTALCRAAWLATGRPFPPSGRAHRASMPGEVYFPKMSAPRAVPRDGTA